MGHFIQRRYRQDLAPGVADGCVADGRVAAGVRAEMIFPSPCRWCPASCDPESRGRKETANLRHKKLVKSRFDRTRR